jgi:hypothetical protein
MKREGNFHEEIMQFSGKTNFSECFFRNNTAGAAFHNVFDLSRRHFHDFRNLFIGVTVNQLHFHDSAVPFGVDVFADSFSDFGVS